MKKYKIPDICADRIDIILNFVLITNRYKEGLLYLNLIVLGLKMSLKYNAQLLLYQDR